MQSCAFQKVGVPPNRHSDFGDFRTKVTDLVSDIIFIVEANECFKQVFQTLFKPIAQPVRLPDLISAAWCYAITEFILGRSWGLSIYHVRFCQITANVNYLKTNNSLK
jgi:hypothetical protein